MTTVARVWCIVVIAVVALGATGCGMRTHQGVTVVIVCRWRPPGSCRVAGSTIRGESRSGMAGVHCCCVVILMATDALRGRRREGPSCVALAAIRNGMTHGEREEIVIDDVRFPTRAQRIMTLDTVR